MQNRVTVSTQLPKWVGYDHVRKLARDMFDDAIESGDKDLVRRVDGWLVYGLCVIGMADEWSREREILDSVNWVIDLNKCQSADNVAQKRENDNSTLSDVLSNRPRTVEGAYIGINKFREAINHHFGTSYDPVSLEQVSAFVEGMRLEGYKYE
ncbi:hypothetical protein AGMMS49992_25900 [Clostridia bacterium]|nr:hypothetical protein AGMMS49992_25900 [Clostridia bacterium]